MKKWNWKKIISGLVLLLSTAAGMYQAKVITGADLANISKGVAEVSEGTQEAADAPAAAE